MAIAGILLAAGSATRAGTNKLLLDLEGEPLVRRAARRAIDAGLDPLLVVTGQDADRVGAALVGLRCLIVPCADWKTGQGASLSTGVRALPADREAAVLLLADMPFVTTDMIRSVVARWRDAGGPIASGRYGDVAAPPTLFARATWPELLEGDGEGKGREVVRHHRDQVAWVDLPDRALADVDVPVDVERARAEAKGSSRARGDDAGVLAQALAWSEAGVGTAIATVTATWGASPRPVGSQMAVNERGAFAGSVSGGCVEAAVIRESLDAIRDGKPRRLEYGVGDEKAWDVGLPCGGTVQIHLQKVAGSLSPGLLRALVGDLQARRTAVLATRLADGETRLLHPGDGSAGGDPLVEAAREAARRDRSLTVETAGGATFLRAHVAPARLVLVGAVHVAQALAPMARLAGLEVVVVDPRRAFGALDRFPDIEVLPEWPTEAFSRIGLDHRTAVVTLTHDPRIDDPALAGALRSSCFYVGALGSRRTQGTRRERLRKEGFSPADLARIHGPVGLPIGGASPGEIAVSILAQVVEALRVGARDPSAPLA